MTEDLDAILRAADPARGVDQQMLEVERQELLEQILASSRTRSRKASDGVPSRRARWAPALGAAAAVGAVTGAIVLWPSQLTTVDDDPGTANVSGSSAAAPGQEAHSSDAGLPPTSDNLHQVVVNAPGWTLMHMDDSRWGGSMGFENDDQWLEISWYEAEDYDTYLADRLEVGPEHQVQALGQTGRAFTYPDEATADLTNLDGPRATSSGPRLRPDYPSGTEVFESPQPLPADADTRVMTIFPPVGDWFLEIDATVADQQDHDALLASLERVHLEAWIASLGAVVVAPSAAEQFLTEASEGVPMPPGLTITAADLNLPQDRYQTSARFVSLVACGWFAEFEAGNEEAASALRGSTSWPPMQTIRSGGDYAAVLQEYVDGLDRGNIDGYEDGLGC